MDYYIDELYEGCVSELNTLYQLDAYRKNTDLLLQQLDGIQKDLRIIFDV